MPEISYFDFKCEEYGFLREYLHYLNPLSLYTVILVCEPKIKKREIIEILNKNSSRQFTISRLDRRLTEIRNKLYQLHHHAEIFQIVKNIKKYSLEDLQIIIQSYQDKEKQ